MKGAIDVCENSPLSSLIQVMIIVNWLALRFLSCELENLRGGAETAIVTMVSIFSSKKEMTAPHQQQCDY